MCKFTTLAFAVAALATSATHAKSPKIDTTSKCYQLNRILNSKDHAGLDDAKLVSISGAAATDINLRASLKLPSFMSGFQESDYTKLFVLAAFACGKSPAELIVNAANEAYLALRAEAQAAEGTGQ